MVDAGAKPLSHWTVHDLRRTAATVMADQLGVLPHIVEAILNHVSGHRAGVAGVYNRARYQAEMRQALERWGACVSDIVEKTWGEVSLSSSLGGDPDSRTSAHKPSPVGRRYSAPLK